MPALVVSHSVSLVQPVNMQMKRVALRASLVVRVDMHRINRVRAVPIVRLERSTSVRVWLHVPCVRLVNTRTRRVALHVIAVHSVASRTISARRRASFASRAHSPMSWAKWRAARAVSVRMGRRAT